MTLEEAFSLRRGDVVETRITGSRGWLPVEVVGFGYRSNRVADVLVKVRRPGRMASGRIFPSFWRAPLSLRRPDRLDPVPANVYADWLEEHGFSAAAAALRKEFPLATGKPSTVPSRASNS
jgi:hypothetical protein